MVQKITLIAGIGHSGSTVLDMALGCHPDIIGLGEVSKVLRTPAEELGHRYNRGLCTCGAVASSCEVWSDYLAWLKRNPDINIENKYDELIPRFQARYGSHAILLDSSKTVRPFMAHLNRHYDVRVIFLVRDVRSWIYSRHTRLGQGILRLALRWHRGNRRTERFIRRHGFRAMLLGYEELAFYPRQMLSRVCDFIGVDFCEEMLHPAGSHSHIIRGNSARIDSEKISEIRYDARWMTSTRLMLEAFWFWPMLPANRRWVYSNFIIEQTKVYGKKQDEVLFFGNRRKELLRQARAGSPTVEKENRPPAETAGAPGADITKNRHTRQTKRDSSL